MGLKIISTAFEHGGKIPLKYTCDGADVSPPLAFRNIPNGTKSIALICDDPDAPMGTWVHWVLFNLPPDVSSLPENLPPQELLENGAKQGKNDFGNLGYGGPCPPGGEHRYYFKVYALDREIDLPAGASKSDLTEAIGGHFLSEGRLMGKYKR